MGLDLVLRKIALNEHDYDYLHVINVDHHRPSWLLLTVSTKLQKEVNGFRSGA